MIIYRLKKILYYYYLGIVITHISFPTAYHIGKEGYVREGKVYEERHIILELMMICA